MVSPEGTPQTTSDQKSPKMSSANRPETLEDVACDRNRHVSTKHKKNLAENDTRKLHNDEKNRITTVIKYFAGSESEEPFLERNSN